MIINQGFYVLGRPRFTPANARLRADELAASTMSFALGNAFQARWKENYIVHLTGDMAEHFKSLQWEDSISLYGNLTGEVEVFDAGFELKGGGTRITAPVLDAIAIRRGSIGETWGANEMSVIQKWHRTQEDAGFPVKYVPRKHYTQDFKELAELAPISQ